MIINKVLIRSQYAFDRHKNTVMFDPATYNLYSVGLASMWNSHHSKKLQCTYLI